MIHVQDTDIVKVYYTNKEQYERYHHTVSERYRKVKFIRTIHHIIQETKEQ